MILVTMASGKGGAATPFASATPDATTPPPRRTVSLLRYGQTAKASVSVTAAAVWPPGFW